LSLAAVFALFNVGVPVVVASCPMVKEQSSPFCTMCNDDRQADGLRISTYFDRSCCETRFAAERNTTEFLQSQQKVERVKLVIEIPLLSSMIQSPKPSFVGNLGADDSSPPLTRDIPIFISSLLI
jgi:hypothetical protein